MENVKINKTSLQKGLIIGVVVLLVAVFFIKKYIDSTNITDGHWEIIAAAAEGYYDYEVVEKDKDGKLTIQEGDDRFTYACHGAWSEGTGSFVTCAYMFEDDSISPGEFLWNKNRTQIDKILGQHNLKTEYRGREAYIEGDFEDASAAFNELLVKIPDFKKSYEIHKRLQGQDTRWEVGSAQEFDSADITVAREQQGLFDWAMEAGL